MNIGEVGEYGRNHHTANVAGGKTPRGFESLPLRPFKNEPVEGLFLLGGERGMRSLRSVE